MVYSKKEIRETLSKRLPAIYKAAGKELTKADLDKAVKDTYKLSQRMNNIN